MEKVKTLATKIIEASDAYYNDQPILNDEEYDALFDRLKKLAPKHPILSRVGFSISETSKLKKVNHRIPMGSLNKVTTKEELEKWVVSRNLDSTLLLLQEKLDGISVELEYDKGQLVTASTRGDGETGEDITHNVRFMQNVSLSINPDFSGSLRGEILLGISEFNKYFKEDGYANPRNTVSGLSRKKKTNPIISNFNIKYFDCVPYDTFKASFFGSEFNMIEFIRNKLGLKTVNSYTVKLDNALKWYDYYLNKQRKNLSYEIDGLVIKCNDIKLQNSLGIKDGRPKGQIALKFPSSTKATKLLDVVWKVGTTGRISPVAVLEPVEVAGVTIRRVNLHNVAYFKRLKLFKGCTVLISRRGDVIPHLEKNLDA